MTTRSADNVATTTPNASVNCPTSHSGSDMSGEKIGSKLAGKLF